ncbi:hypothetical protein F5883DRAFT_605636 [Diaporthe sp. PMI_573]|nr:hypothetical protein F5883DRAFT_605636 [Diaporthaceae sp. PMI_573]
MDPQKGAGLISALLWVCHSFRMVFHPVRCQIPQDGLSEAFTEPTLPDTEDGYGWIVTISVALINGHSWGISSIYSVFLAHFLANNTFPGITKLQYTLVRSLTVGYTLLISPLIIIAVRKFRTRPTMLVGTVSESVGLVYTSLLIQIWHFFLLQGILFGIAITGTGLNGFSLLKEKEYLIILSYSFISILGYFILIFTLANYTNIIYLDTSQLNAESFKSIIVFTLIAKLIKRVFWITLALPSTFSLLITLEIFKETSKYIGA